MFLWGLLVGFVFLIEFQNPMQKPRQGAEIDIIDRLPMPFGLVHSGVASDHPKTKVFKIIIFA